MSEPTPGPWRVGRDGTVVADCQHEGNHLMDESALSFYGGHLLAESIARAADARMMAAALELYEALEMVRDADDDRICDGLLDRIPPMARAKIDAALGKAKP